MSTRDLRETIRKYNELKGHSTPNVHKQKREWINDQMKDYSSDYYQEKPNKDILHFIANFI